MNLNEFSKYLCFILRHHPEEIFEKPKEHMDSNGYVDIDDLITAINNHGDYKKINKATIMNIVETDDKSRYKVENNKIKCNQGHSIDWVSPTLEIKEPPKYLYHGTTVAALKKIMNSGHLSKMARHAVHMHADIEAAKKSALRWNIPAVVIKIDASNLYNNGVEFGVTENHVWCAEEIPSTAFVDYIYLNTK